MGSRDSSEPFGHRGYGKWGFAFDEDHPLSDCTSIALSTLISLLVVLNASFAIQLANSIHKKTLTTCRSIFGNIAWVLCNGLLILSISSTSWGITSDARFDWFSQGDHLPTQYPPEIAVRINTFQAFYISSMSGIKLALLVCFFESFTISLLPLRARLSGRMGTLFIVEFLVYIGSIAINWYWYGRGYIQGAVLEQELAIEMPGLVNATVDGFLMLVPIYGMWRLKMRRRDIISLIAIVLLGLSVTVLSLLRSLLFSTDLAYMSAHWSPARWTMYNYNMMNAEVVLGYVCYCLPAFNDFFLKSDRLTLWCEGLKKLYKRGVRQGPIERKHHKCQGSDVSRALSEEESQIELVKPEMAFMTSERL